MINNLGNKIRELRLAFKLSQEDLAKKLDISIKSIQRYENNKSTPSNFSLIKIAEYFNVSSDYLLGLNSYIAESEITENIDHNDYFLSYLKCKNNQPDDDEYFWINSHIENGRIINGEQTEWVNFEDKDSKKEIKRICPLIAERAIKIYTNIYGKPLVINEEKDFKIFYLMEDEMKNWKEKTNNYLDFYSWLSNFTEKDLNNLYKVFSEDISKNLNRYNNQEYPIIFSIYTDNKMYNSLLSSRLIRNIMKFNKVLVIDDCRYTLLAEEYVPYSVLPLKMLEILDASIEDYLPYIVQSKFENLDYIALEPIIESSYYSLKQDNNNLINIMQNKLKLLNKYDYILINYWKDGLNLKEIVFDEISDISVFITNNDKDCRLTNYENKLIFKSSISQLYEHLYFGDSKNIVSDNRKESYYIKSKNFEDNKRYISAVLDKELNSFLDLFQKRLCKIEKLKTTKQNAHNFLKNLPIRQIQKYCEHCNSNLYTEISSSGNYLDNKFFCLNCGHVEYENALQKCFCSNCEERRKHLEYERKRKIIMDHHSDHTVKIENVKDLAVKDIIKLSALISLSIEKDYKSTIPYENINENFTPSSKWDREIIVELYKNKYIDISEKSSIKAFPPENFGNEYYYYRVRYYPTLGENYEKDIEWMLFGDLCTIFDSIEEENINQIVDDIYDFWSKTILKECTGFLENKLKEENIEIEIDEIIIEKIKSLTMIFAPEIVLEVLNLTVDKYLKKSKKRKTIETFKAVMDDALENLALLKFKSINKDYAFSFITKFLYTRMLNLEETNLNQIPSKRFVKELIIEQRLKK